MSAGNLPLCIIRVLDRELHVRLAGGNPHIADENVVQVDVRSPAVDHHFVRSARFHCRQRHSPRAVRTNHRAFHASVKCGRHLGARRPPAPHRYAYVALQHHAVAKDPR